MSLSAFLSVFIHLLSLQTAALAKQSGDQIKFKWKLFLAVPGRVIWVTGMEMMVNLSDPPVYGS